MFWFDILCIKMILMKADVFWDVTPCTLVEVYQLCRAISSDYQYTAARLCAVIFQETVFLLVNAMRTSDVTTMMTAIRVACYRLKFSLSVCLPSLVSVPSMLLGLILSSQYIVKIIASFFWCTHKNIIM